MSDRTTDRRTVLKVAGAGIVGGASLVGSASADPPDDNGPIHVVPTWGDHEVWELIDAEPPSRDRLQDAEGTHTAQAPLYIIEPISGGSHSPMFAGIADQVVPVPGGPARREYSAQWHLHPVVDPAMPFLPPGHPDNPLPNEPFPNLVNEDQNGDPLTSATAIEEATNVATPGLPPETAFTCPVRPHHDQGPKD